MDLRYLTSSSCVLLKRKIMVVGFFEQEVFAKHHSGGSDGLGDRKSRMRTNLFGYSSNIKFDVPWNLESQNPLREAQGSYLIGNLWMIKRCSWCNLLINPSLFQPSFWQAELWYKWQLSCYQIFILVYHTPSILSQVFYFLKPESIKFGPKVM